MAWKREEAWSSETLERMALRATMYVESMEAWAAEGMEGRAPEWTSWRASESGGMDWRNERLDVRAWRGGAS
jgi:hypothetical protein